MKRKLINKLESFLSTNFELYSDADKLNATWLHLLIKIIFIVGFASFLSSIVDVQNRNMIISFVIFDLIVVTLNYNLMRKKNIIEELQKITLYETPAIHFYTLPYYKMIYLLTKLSPESHREISNYLTTLTTHFKIIPAGVDPQNFTKSEKKKIQKTDSFPQNIDNNNFQSFIMENIKTSPSLIKSAGDKFEKNKKYNFNFLHWLITIPQIKNIDPEITKQFILGYQWNSIHINHIFTESKSLSTDEFKNSIQHMFSNYTPNDIKLLYLSGYSGQDYQKVFKYCANVSSKVKPFEVVRSFEILSATIIEKIVLNDALSKVNGQTIDGYRFYFLSNLDEYNKGSQIMSNCVRGHYGSHCDILIVFKEEKPFACIDFRSNLEVKEFSGHNNKKIDTHERNHILSIIQQFDSKQVS